MPLIGAIAGLLLRLVGPLTGRILLALGMSFVTYKGVGAGIDWLFQSIKTNIASLDPRVIQFLAYMWVDKAISMIFSAYAAAAAIRLATSGSITKLVTKGSS